MTTAWDRSCPTCGHDPDEPIDYGTCTCARKWPLYLGTYDQHGRTLRCRGCLRIPKECTCR